MSLPTSALNTRSRGGKIASTLMIAGILSALGTGSYITWSANATASDTEKTDPAAGTLPKLPTIDMDSLYHARAVAEQDADTTVIREIAPTRQIQGKISWYGPGFHGRRTASGERFDRNEMTAAHKTLPFGTLVRVTDVASGRSVLVRINDRGPYSHGRVLDLSEEAASRLGMRGRGTANARIEVYALPKRDADTTSISFAPDGRALDIVGYGVRLMKTSSYDEAVALRKRLVDEGRSDVYLTVERDGKSLDYQIMVGLYGSRTLCATLLGELIGNFKGATIAPHGNTTTTAVAAVTTPADEL